MDKRPEWVPDWLWAEYVDLRKWHSAYLQQIPRIVQRVDAIISSQDCASVWKAIDARKATLDAREPPDSLRDNFRYLAMLLEIAANAEGIPPAEALSASMRARKGATIAKLARDLRAAIMDIVHEDAPEAFGASLFEFIERQIENYVPHANRLLGVDLSTECAAACKGAYRDAVERLVLEDFAGVLEAFERAANALAKSTPPVTQLRSPDAARLHFVRTTTDLMRHHFGTPLREQVAALTRVLFDCEMNAAAVTKMAP